MVARQLGQSIAFHLLYVENTERAFFFRSVPERTSPRQQQQHTVTVGSFDSPLLNWLEVYSEHLHVEFVGPRVNRNKNWVGPLFLDHSGFQPSSHHRMCEHSHAMIISSDCAKGQLTSELNLFQKCILRASGVCNLQLIVMDTTMIKQR